MSQFIIATHSYLANGYKHAINFFDNSVLNVHFINSYIDEQKNFTNELKLLLSKYKKDQIIIFTDIPGGSVNTEAVKFINNFDCKIISGINLPLVLELVLNKEKKLSDEKIREAIKQAREQIVFMNDLIKEGNLE